MAKIRVIHRADGEISILELGAGVKNFTEGKDPRQKTPNEIAKEALARANHICKKLEATHPLFSGATWEDVDKNTLPADRKDRDKWRSKPGRKGVKVDATIVLPAEVRAADQAAFDAELVKASPNSKKAMALMAKIQKNRY